MTNEIPVGIGKSTYPDNQPTFNEVFQNILNLKNHLHEQAKKQFLKEKEHMANRLRYYSSTANNAVR